MLKQLPVEADFVRCNSLGLNGNILVVARQSEKVGQPHGGITVYDVSDPANPELLSYMDLTGSHSRGTHYLTFPDGGFRTFRPAPRTLFPGTRSTTKC